MLFSTGERRNSFARKENDEKDKKTAREQATLDGLQHESSRVILWHGGDDTP